MSSKQWIFFKLAIYFKIQGKKYKTSLVFMLSEFSFKLSINNLNSLNYLFYGWLLTFEMVALKHLSVQHFDSLVFRGLLSIKESKVQDCVNDNKGNCIEDKFMSWGKILPSLLYEFS